MEKQARTGQASYDTARKGKAGKARTGLARLTGVWTEKAWQAWNVGIPSGMARNGQIRNG